MVWTTEIPACRLKVLREELSELKPILKQRGFDEEIKWIERYVAKCAELERRVKEVHKAAKQSGPSIHSDIQDNTQKMVQEIEKLLQPVEFIKVNVSRMNRNETDTILLGIGRRLYDIGLMVRTGFVEKHRQVKALKEEFKPYRSGRKLSEKRKILYDIIGKEVREDKRTKKRSKSAVITNLCKQHSLFKGCDPVKLRNSYDAYQRRKSKRKKKGTRREVST